MTDKTCNFKRCRKPAIMGFRPHENGFDVAARVGKQYRCELHSKDLLRDGKPFTPGTWLIRRKAGSR